LSQSSPTLIARFFYYINNVFALATLAGYVAWFINPKHLAWAELAALSVPGLMIVNVVFVLIWLVFYRRYAVLSLVVLALSWWHINTLYGFGGKTESGTETMRVMSYNVRNFRYTWPGKIAKDNPGMVAITDSIKPDILCMQEYLGAVRAVPNFKMRYKYIPKKSGITLAIYSNYPIISKGEVPFGVSGGGYNTFIYADVLRGNDTLRIINVHLMSIRLDEKDFESFTEIDIEKLDEERLAQSGKSIVKRLRNAAPIRGVQASAVASFIALSPHPVILCGDLNATPTTYAYRQLTKNLKDTFRQAGSGFGTTHPKFAKYHLPLRIDHILASESFTATNWHVVESDLSDHFAVYADLMINDKAP
jgi:endonuclease/exonuclease/phosphatase family metal-dependent hydrolase